MAMPSIPDDLHGRELWLMLARDQFGRGLLTEVDAILVGAFKEIVTRILVDYPNLGLRDAQRLAGLFSRVSNLLADRYNTVSSHLTASLQGFSAIESAIARDEIALRVGSIGGVESSLGVLTRQRIVSIADVLVEGQHLPEWWRSQARTMADVTRRQIQTGLVLGEGPAEIVRRILPPSRGLPNVPAVLPRARRDASALVRTAVTAVGGDASFLAYASAATGITDRYEWVSTLDGRTSKICIALSGKQFRYDDPKAPRPAAHINCRSTIRPVIQRRALGIGAPEEQGAGGWADFGHWLSSRPKTEQDAILGVGRASLWRERKINLRDLVASDSRVLTLKQLQSLATVRDVARV